MIERPFNCVNECTYHPHWSHNEFCRVLYKKGILDLMLYITFLAGTGVKVILRRWRNKAPLNRLGIMLLGMLMLDAMGFVRGDYPGIQIFGLGFVGFPLRRLEEDLNKITNASPVNVKLSVKASMQG